MYRPADSPSAAIGHAVPRLATRTQQLASQKAAYLGPVAWFRANGRRRPNGSHATDVHHKSHDTANHQGQHPLIQTHRLEKALESGQCILHDDHREAPSSARENTIVGRNRTLPKFTAAEEPPFHCCAQRSKKAQLQNLRFGLVWPGGLRPCERVSTNQPCRNPWPTF